MKGIIYTLTLLVAAILATACGGGVNPDRNNAIAREAIARGEYKEALAALDEARSTMADTTASPGTLTETAALYCVIDERQKSEDNMAKALKCYELAMRINPDSVRHCFARLSTDEKCHLDLLDKLLTARHDIPDHVEMMEADSLTVAGYDDMEIISDLDIMQ